MTDPVLVERRGGVQVITINRPEAKNSLDVTVSRALADAADELDASDELRVGVLTGAGGTFSAGMDLKAWVQTGELPVIPGRGLCGLTLRPPRKPLIAAVEGWALAGGFELLLACDLVIASETARFGVPEIKRGLVAGAGAALLLPQRLPLALSLEILLTGDPLSATRAAEMGLVNKVTPEGGALDAAMELADKIAGYGPLAVAATKAIARGAADWGVADGWARQDEYLQPVLASEDALEGAKAFAERRAPVWKGR